MIAAGDGQRLCQIRIDLQLAVVVLIALINARDDRLVKGQGIGGGVELRLAVAEDIALVSVGDLSFAQPEVKRRSFSFEDDVGGRIAVFVGDHIVADRSVLREDIGDLRSDFNARKAADGIIQIGGDLKSGYLRADGDRTEHRGNRTVDHRAAAVKGDALCG